jgi:hypothetical protein
MALVTGKLCDRNSRAERRKQEENLEYLQKSKAEVTKCMEVSLASIDEKIAEVQRNKTP